MTKTRSNLAVSLLSITSAYAFTNTPSSISSALSSNAFINSKTQICLSDSAIPPQQSRGTKMSEAIPFLKCPPYLNGELPGDVGFDPLGLGKNEKGVLEMREAEIKHARLAMLAAAGWPISELYDKQIASFFNVDPILDATDRAPSILNGGLEKVVPEWWGFCLGLTAAIEIYGLEKQRAAQAVPALFEEAEDGSDMNAALMDPYFPGNLGFDPLGLYPKDEKGKKRMQLCEIKHGRVAMIAVVAYSLEEAISKVAVVDETPIFFTPLL